jgi:hypothetical protein
MAASKSSSESKALVDRGEAEVCDFVQLAQGLEDRQTDLVRFDLGAALGANALLDALCQDREVVLGDGAPLAGLANSDEDLLAAERLSDARALDDAQAGGLDGGEAATALRALAPPADRGAVVSGPRVDDPGVVVAAEGAVHRGGSLLGTVRGT